MAQTRKTAPQKPETATRNKGPKAGSIITHTVKASDYGNRVGDDDEYPMIVVTSDPETGAYAGTVFLPNGETSFVTVNPESENTE